MSLSLYRKYRPQTFGDVIGQEHVEKTLVNAVADGNVAHAYLFCGPRGTGKTTTARLLAKALLCGRGPTAEPDGTCQECLEIAAGTHPDVYELDAASRTGVENVREEIISRVNFAPTRGRYKVYIIDEVHMLSTAAFNALLKTLEEPPEHVVFVLCTTDPHKVPETIQSRCQRFDFRRFSIDEIVRYLERVSTGEGFSYEPEALEFIAAKSAGGMRDATTALEQVGVFTEGAITLAASSGLLGQVDTSSLFEIAEHIARRDAAGCFAWLGAFIQRGTDLTQFAHDLASHMRDLYVTALTGGEGGIVACSAADLFRYQAQADAFGGTDRLARALSICGDLVNELRNSSDARLSVEIAMTRLCRPESDLTLESLAERIEVLEALGVPAARPSTASIPATTMPQAEQREAVTRATPVMTQVVETCEEPARQAEPANGERAAVGEEAQEAPSERVESPRQAVDMSPARLWAAVLTDIKREDVATGAMLNGASLEEGTEGYRIVFPANGEFAMKLVSKGEAHDLLAAAFEHVTGHPVAFTCELAGGRKRSRGAASPTNAQEATREAEDAGGDAPAFIAEPSFASPDARPVDEETAADIADALSAFGGNIKLEEVDDE